MPKSKKKVLEDLERVRYVGSAVAKSMYEDHGVRTIADIVELGDDGNLTELRGVGQKKAKTILTSANHILDMEQKQQEQEQQEQEQQEQEQQEEEQQQAAEQRARRANGRAPGAAAAAAGTTATRAGTAGATTEARTTTSPEPTPDERSLRERFIDTLRCPACGHDRFDVGATTMTCQACQRQFNLQNGIADLAPPAPPDRSITQKLMESRTYTRFYEEFMRPRLTKVVSNRSMREEYRLAAEFLDFEEDIRLLDVGCGTANFTRYLAQRLGLAETPADEPGLPLVVGMDLSWPMLENARRNIQQENLQDKIFLLRGDGTRIPVRRGAYNRLHCAGTLHLMSDIDEALRNFARVLEANGICVIGTFVLGKGLIRRTLKRIAEFPTDFHWFSRDELFRRIERAGFEVIDSSIAGDAITVKARRI